VIRKQLCGVGRFDRLGAAGYTPEVSSRVYAELAERARRVLSAGHSVIVDAVFLRPSDRTAIEAVAQQAGVPLRGFWLEAPDAVLLDRLRLRRNDPSDADADTLAGQRHVDRGPLSWPVLDAEDPHLREKLRPMTTANDGIPTVSAQF
jgi:predicted kinase